MCVFKYVTFALGTQDTHKILMPDVFVAICATYTFRLFVYEECICAYWRFRTNIDTPTTVV